MEFFDGVPEDVFTAFLDNKRASLGSIKFYQLLVLVDNECNEVMLHCRLVRIDLSTLTLSSLGLVFLLEVFGILKIAASLCRSLTNLGICPLLKNAALFERHLISFIESCMQASNDSTCIVESTSLFHVKWYNAIGLITSFDFVFLFLESFYCYDHTDNWLRKEIQQFFVESVYFSESPFF